MEIAKNTCAARLTKRDANPALGTTLLDNPHKSGGTTNETLAIFRRDLHFIEYQWLER